MHRLQDINCEKHDKIFFFLERACMTRFCLSFCLSCMCPHLFGGCTYHLQSARWCTCLYFMCWTSPSCHRGRHCRVGHPSGVVSAPRHILTALAALTAKVVVRAHRIALGSQPYNGYRAVWVRVSVQRSI